MTSISKSFFAVVAGVGAGTGGAVVRTSHLFTADDPRSSAPQRTLTHAKKKNLQAKRFAKAYPVVLLARREESYKDVVAEINGAGGRALGISTDTSDPASVAAAFRSVAAAEELSGLKLAAAVYNVGAGRSLRPFLEMTPEDLDNSLKGNA